MWSLAGAVWRPQTGVGISDRSEETPSDIKQTLWLVVGHKKSLIFIRGLSCPTVLPLAFSVGHCISLHTISKSPGSGLLLPGDLGFLSAQHMLHSYCLCVVLPFRFCFPLMQPQSLFREKPVVFSVTDKCQLREEIKKWWHSMKTNCSFENILLHLLGFRDGRILKRSLCNKQVCWGNNITRLLTNCWLEEEGIYSVGFSLQILLWI